MISKLKPTKDQRQIITSQVSGNNGLHADEREWFPKNHDQVGHCLRKDMSTFVSFDQACAFEFVFLFDFLRQF